MGEREKGNSERQTKKRPVRKGRAVWRIGACATDGSSQSSTHAHTTTTRRGVVMAMRVMVHGLERHGREV